VSDIENPDHTNIDLIYQYTESRLKLASDNINNLNSRLGLSIGFSVLVIRFGIEVDNPHLRIMLCCAALISIVVSLAGLKTNKTGSVNKIDDLLDNFYYDTDERIKLRIIRTWKIGIKELEHSADYKGRCLNFNFLCFFVSALLFAIGVMTN
jgi:hypothetical protein